MRCSIEVRNKERKKCSTNLFYVLGALIQFSGSSKEIYQAGERTVVSWNNKTIIMWSHGDDNDHTMTKMMMMVILVVLNAMLIWVLA